MYLNSNEIERAVLRQGDIISKTHIIGALDLSKIQYSTNITGESMFWSVPEKPLYAPAIVLSYSCEIERDNGSKVTSIVLAPLRDVNKIGKKEVVEDIIEKNLINDTTTHSYLKYFYLEPNENLPEYTKGCVVDFSKCYSLTKQSYDKLLDSKIIQLNEISMNALALKYALYFYRECSA